MGIRGTWCSREFKAEAVKQVVDRGCSVRKDAQRLGVASCSLQRRVSGGRAEAKREILRKAAALLPYEHVGKLQFRTPLLTDQNTTYKEEFRFEMTAAGRVKRAIEPGMLSKPFRFK